jgi:hypothetical protein
MRKRIASYFKRKASTSVALPPEPEAAGQGEGTIASSTSQLPQSSSLDVPAVVDGRDASAGGNEPRSTMDGARLEHDRDVAGLDSATKSPTSRWGTAPVDAASDVVRRPFRWWQSGKHAGPTSQASPAAGGQRIFTQ